MHFPPGNDQRPVPPDQAADRLPAEEAEPQLRLRYLQQQRRPDPAGERGREEPGQVSDQPDQDNHEAAHSEDGRVLRQRQAERRLLHDGQGLPGQLQTCPAGSVLGEMLLQRPQE